MTLEEMRQHEWIVSWSGGKDSTATILLMRQYNIPIKKIIYVRMMWDEELPATLPIMTDFVDKTADVFKSWGYDVEIVKSRRTALELAQSRYVRSIDASRNGEKYGAFAFFRGYCKFTGVKQNTIVQTMKQHNGQYQMIGYAVDETKRTHRLGGLKQSIMVALNVTEKQAREICAKADMLSPLYEYKGISRDGCWFCPNANKAERERLKKEHPELVEKIDEIIAWGGYLKLGGTIRNNWVKDFLEVRGWQEREDLNRKKEKPKPKKEFEQLSIFDLLKEQKDEEE